jgi:hypothetical protein
MAGGWRTVRAPSALALAAGCAAPDTGGGVDPAYEETLVVVADSAGERFRYLRLDRQVSVLDIDLDMLDPQRCGGGTTCVAFGAEPSVDPETGDDRLLVTYAPHEDGATSVSTVAMLRITADHVTVDWSFTALDFQTYFATRPDLCSAAAACTLPGEDFDTRRACGLYHSHDVELVSETAAGAVLWIADTTRPSRALRVLVPPGGECATVEAVISAQTVASMPELEDANDVDAITVDGEDLVLVSFMSGTASGLGAYAAFRGDADAWELAWRYPEDGPLAAPHGPMVMDDADGGAWLVYANGNGNGATARAEEYTEADHRGTIGFARFVDGIPRYVEEIDAPGGLGFTRDVEPLPGNRWLVTDSGCHENTATECSNTAYVRQLEHAPGGDPAEVDGKFSPDHAFQVITEAPEPADTWPSPMECDLLTPYETDWVPSPGAGLQARQDRTSSSCRGFGL